MSTFSGHCEWRIGVTVFGKAVTGVLSSIGDHALRMQRAQRIPGWLAIERRCGSAYGPWCDARGDDPLGRREQVGWLAAAVVDAAVFRAVVRIRAQAIGLRFPRSWNIGSGPVEEEESRGHWDLSGGTRINRPVMHGKMTTDRRMVFGFHN